MGVGVAVAKMWKVKPKATVRKETRVVIFLSQVERLRTILIIL